MKVQRKFKEQIFSAQGREDSGIVKMTTSKYRKDYAKKKKSGGGVVICSLSLVMNKMKGNGLSCG